MQSSLLADDDLPDAASLVASVTERATPGHFDEWCAGTGSTAAAAGHAPAPHWRQFFHTLGTEGWADLGARAQRVQHRVREDGATYNVYAEGQDTPRAWPLELLPFIVPAGEWARIEAGVTQRARLMAATLADIYGPQTLLRDALLPASLVFAHPHYLRPACGLWPAARNGLHIAAFDLARTPQGDFRLLAQRLQAPSGLGYLLENRLIIAPQFHDQFSDLHVQRLAGTFRGLLDGLVRASPAGERSRIVLLTPGPLNETYFEQVFLARYLGVTLVEGSDLTVRGNKLYLKTLHGLEQVHVLLRRVDDEFLDPLELRPDSQLGVPGLLQALRAGEVVMANAPGAGVLESPGLAAFWPGVARRLLGEDLLLPASTSWWCGEAAVWRDQQQRLADFVVAPTFPDSGFGPKVPALMGEAERAALRAGIDANPAAYTLQARVRPSETPVWSADPDTPDQPGGQLHPRAAVMRVFALADGQGGWRVLPGALTRVATRSSQQPGSAHDPWLSMQHGAASVDTWVVASGAVDRSTLLPKPLTADELASVHRAVTSRAAENLFWLGRYTERAENSVRLVRLMLEMLREGSEPVLRLLDRLARFHGLVGAGVPGVLKAPRVFERALIHGLVPRHPDAAVDAAIGGPTTSVAHNLRSLRQCAQNLRERLSPEHWKLIHEVGDHLEQHLGVVLSLGEGHAPVPDVLGILARATTHLAAITGAQTDRMTRDDGWRLLSVGRQIERLDMLAHALGLGFELKVHEADDGFNLLLGLFDSVITYRAQFQGRREVLPLLHLLAMDTDNPRSLAWVARTMRDRLRKLARHDPAWVAEVTRELPAPEDWRLARLATPDDKGRHGELVEALRHCSSAARGLSDQISRHLFAHVQASDRRVAVSATAKPPRSPRLLQVVHETGYDYDTPVEVAHHSAWLRPRDTELQQVQRWSLQIDPPPDSAVQESQDAFGNWRHGFGHSRVHERLTVTSRFQVLLAAPPELDADHSPPWEEAAQALRYRAGVTQPDAVEFVLPSHFAPHAPELAAFAQDLFSPGRPLLQAAQALMTRVHQRMQYKPHSTDVATNALQALAQGQGVCQDFAHLMIGALRSLGLAARYVSGYLLTHPPEGQPRLVGADASHAWAAVWCPLHGWVALDPTNDVQVGQDHVTLAWGRDYADVAPLRGVIRGGGTAPPVVGVTVEPV